MTLKIKFILWHIFNYKYSFQLFILFINYFIKNKTKNNQVLKKWIASNLISVENFFKNQNFKLKNFYFENKSITEEAEEIEKNITNLIIKADKTKLGGRADLNLLYNLVFLKNPKLILETGVALGWSSLSILTALKKNSNFGSRLISIDMRYPLVKNYNKYRAIVVQDKSNWHLIDAIDFFGIFKADKIINNKKYDLIHYDSDKTYLGRRISYMRLWKRLNIGGYFLSDDISDNTAFFDFCESKKLIPNIFELNNRYVGLLIKSK